MRFSSTLGAAPGGAYTHRPVSQQPAVADVLPPVPVEANAERVPEASTSSTGQESRAESGAESAAASAVVPEPLPEQVTEPKPEPEQPVAAAQADLPWWLSDSPHTAEPTRPPVIWQPAKVWPAQQRGEETAPAVAAATERPAQPPRAAAPQSWNRPPVPGGARAKEVAAPEQTPVGDESSARNSRLSGLRNLLFVLGVKNPSGAEEAGDSNGAPGSAANPRMERLSYERTVLEAQENAARNLGGAIPRQVMAKPEFLPPKPLVVEFDEADIRMGESSTRQDRRISADGVEILPSKRGQYKKL